MTNRHEDISIPEESLREWQGIVDLVVRLARVPVGLIMKVCYEDIEVLVASSTPRNPYHVGEKECLAASGLYCEEVISKQSMLLVPNALKSERWRTNPDLKHNLVSYLGFPIRFPDGKPFGTICLLDDKENEYSPDLIDVMEKMRDLIERELRHRVDMQRLERARETAENATQAKSHFLAIMSHEVRTPLNGVLGMTQILAQEPLLRDQQQMVDDILTAGRSLLSIINDILDLSKIEAGQLQLDPRPFDLNRTLAHVIGISEVTAHVKGIELRLETDPAIAGVWLGDSLRLEQVLFNLVGNAIKFTGQGEVTIHVRPLTMSEGHGRFRFEIRDTGIGMDAETQAELFTPYRQADTSIARRFGGTGLGLSISKLLVEMMGGVIGVSSMPGVGSTFWFEWPAVRAAMANLAVDNLSASDARMGTGPLLDGLCVLVVDDNAINRTVAERALTLAGAACTLASDGEQALSILRGQTDAYDVVLMDIQMPGMDGLTATREIRRNPSLAKIPVLGLSAGVLKEEREAALAAGMDDFITKPLDLMQIRNTLVKYLPDS